MADEKPPQRSIPELRAQTVCLMILTGIAVAVALRQLAVIMVPLALALFFCYGLTPLIAWQIRWIRLPRIVAVATTAAIGVVCLLLALQLVSSSIDEFDQKRDVYHEKLKVLVAQATRFVKSIPLLKQMRLIPDAEGEDTEAGAKSASNDEEGQKSRGERFLERFGSTIRAFFLGVSAAGLDILSQAFLVLLFMMFFLFGRSIGHAPEGTIWREVERKVQQYILAKVFLSLLTAVAVGVTLWLLGVDMVMVFALLTFVLNFIPNIGSIVAVALPLPVVLLSDLSPTAQILAFVIPLCIQMSIGNLLEPKMMGSSFDLHPVVILIALIFWGMILGFVGMFLAVPITAVLKLFLERLELTAPIARAMAGRIMRPAEEDAPA